MEGHVESGHRGGCDQVDHYLGEDPGSDGRGRTYKAVVASVPTRQLFRTSWAAAPLRCGAATPSIDRSARHLQY